MNLELADKVGGRSNSSPLTAHGRQQSQALGRHLHKVFIAQGLKPTENCNVFSSTAVRAVETARLAMQALGIPANHLITSNEILEQCMGAWEGAKRAECYTPHVLKNIEADTHGFAAPGGESQRDVELRMIKFLNSVLQASTEQRRLSLVFGHGMAFKCVLRHILDSDARMSRKIALHNTAITEIGYVPMLASIPGSLQPGWHILRVNDSGHLVDSILQDEQSIY